MMNYYIVGLPRSMTGWLAVALTDGPSYCHHEALGRASTWAEYDAAMRLDGYLYVGNSDSAMALAPEAIPDEAPVVVVRRDPEDVVASLVRAFPESWAVADALIERVLAGLEWLVRRRACLVIEYEHVAARFAEIWQHCLPGVPFDARRAELLARMRIHVDPEILRASIHDKNRAFVQSLLERPVAA